MAELKEIYNDPVKVRQIAIAAFQTIDTDRSGYIDLNELEALMKDMAGQLSIPAPSTQDVQKAFQDIDKDRDRKINLNEFTFMVGEILRILAGLWS